MADLAAITRFELIDKSGRLVVIRRDAQEVNFELSLQDEGRTLKLIARDRVQILPAYPDTK